jgi:hypothetical protein
MKLLVMQSSPISISSTLDPNILLSSLFADTLNVLIVEVK